MALSQCVQEDTSNWVLKVMETFQVEGSSRSLVLSSRFFWCSLVGRVLKVKLFKLRLCLAAACEDVGSVVWWQGCLVPLA